MGRSGREDLSRVVGRFAPSNSTGKGTVEGIDCYGEGLGANCQVASRSMSDRPSSIIACSLRDSC